MGEIVKKALVTGGAGFIGSHLCGYLLEQGWQVTALDDFSTGRVENVAHLQDCEKFALVEGDAADVKLVTDAACEGGALFHLAAVVGVQKVVDDPVGTIERNHSATRSVLSVAREKDMHFLVTSSSEVYGANPKPAFQEDDICMIGPTHHRRWSYSASKLMDEFHTYSYHYAYDLPTVIVRLFNTVGPRQVGRYGMVVPRFVGQALRGEPITVYGDGSQRRCFTYVGDVVHALHDLMVNDKANGKVFNVGSSRELSILELAEKVKNLLGSESPIVFQSYHEAYGHRFEDVLRRRPDTSRLQDVIGFVPDTLVDESLRRVTEYLRGVEA